jgi:secretion/DNA translocation related TadE-like protein
MITVRWSRPAGAARWHSGEQGSATIVGLGAVITLLAVFAVALQLGAAVITRHRAQSAADLAALAAAAYAVGGTSAACATAQRVTDRMAVRMVSCELSGWEASVWVEAVPPGMLARLGTARAEARAGPVDAAAATEAATGGHPR